MDSHDRHELQSKLLKGDFVRDCSKGYEGGC